MTCSDLDDLRLHDVIRSYYSTKSRRGLDVSGNLHKQRKARQVLRDFSAIAALVVYISAYIKFSANPSYHQLRSQSVDNMDTVPMDIDLDALPDFELQLGHMSDVYFFL